MGEFGVNDVERTFNANDTNIANEKKTLNSRHSPIREIRVEDL